MGYIKNRMNGYIEGMYCDVCGKEYVKVIANPNDKNQDMCENCYNSFFNGNKINKNNWTKLKEWIESELTTLVKKKEIVGELDCYDGGRLNQCNYILYKMGELESEERK